MILYLPHLSNSLFMDDAQLIFDPQDGLITVPTISDFWIHATSHSRTWPLSYSLLWLLWPLFGKNYVLYKVFNLGLHLLNGFLLYRLSQRLKLAYPLLIATTFLVHPYQVETVCWIFQIKTLLSTFFFLLSYHLFLSSLATKDLWFQKISYCSTLITFLFSLWAKITALFGPLIFIFHFKSLSKKWLLTIIPFLLLSWWQGTKSWNGVTSNPAEMREKEERIKFIATQKNKTKVEIQKGTFYFQMPQVITNFNFYFSNFFFPRPNLTNYPHQTTLEKVTNFILTVALIILAIILIFLQHPYGLTCSYFLIFYSLAIIPVLGLIYVPYMKFSDVADHWAYLATIPLSMLLVTLWNFSSTHCSKTFLKRSTNLVLIGIFSYFIYSTFTYTKIFNDKEKETKHLLKYNHELQFVPVIKSNFPLGN